MEKNIKDKVMEEVKRRGLVTEQKKDTNKFDEMCQNYFIQEHKLTCFIFKLNHMLNISH